MESNIWKIYVMTFFNSFFFMSGVLIPFFTDWGGLSLSQTLSLQSIFMVACFAFEFPSGALADRFGKKKSLCFSFCFASLGFFTYGITPDFKIFALAEILLALGISLTSGTISSFVSSTLKELGKSHLRKKVLGRTASFSMAGILISAPLGGIIAHYYGLRETMFLTVFSPIFALMIGLTLIEPRNGNKRKTFLEIIKAGALCFKQSKALRRLAIDRVVVQILCFFLIWIYQPLLKQEGVLIIYFGIVHAAICISQIVILNNFSCLERICGSKKNYLFFSSLICALSFCLIGFASTGLFWKILAILIISGFGLSRKILLDNYMLEHTEEAYQTTALSFVEMFRKIITAILYPLIGLLMEHSINYTFLCIGIILLIFTFIPILKDEYLKN